MKNLATALLLFAGLATFSGCSDDDDDVQPTNTVTLSGDLTAAKTPSTTAQPGPVVSSGTGTVSGSYDKKSKLLTYSVAYRNLTGPAVAGHFHVGGPTQVTSIIAVSFTNVQTSPITGTATLTQAQEDELLKGNFYANLHTSMYREGEIRSQVTVK